jgi:hypothetical protein
MPTYDIEVEKITSSYKLFEIVAKDEEAAKEAALEEADESPYGWEKDDDVEFNIESIMKTADDPEPAPEWDAPAVLEAAGQMRLI